MPFTCEDKMIGERKPAECGQKFPPDLFTFRTTLTAEPSGPTEEKCLFPESGNDSPHDNAEDHEQFMLLLFIVMKHL